MKRLVQISWKLAIVAAIVGLIVYRARFAPVPVAGRVATVGQVAARMPEQTKMKGERE